MIKIKLLLYDTKNRKTIKKQEIDASPRKQNCVRYNNVFTEPLFKKVFFFFTDTRAILTKA
jgi:hypothetical protein